MYYTFSTSDDKLVQLLDDAEAGGAEALAVYADLQAEIDRTNEAFQDKPRTIWQRIFDACIGSVKSIDYYSTAAHDAHFARLAANDILDIRDAITKGAVEVVLDNVTFTRLNHLSKLVH